MGKVALILMGAVFLLSGAISAGEAEASIVKRYKAKHGTYRCHKHNRHIKREKGVDWSSRKDKRGRSVVHCFKQKAKRNKRRSVGSSAWVLPRYVVMCESGGNPRAVNYSNPLRPAGLYQIITPTWLGYGGGRFASTADRASVYEQGVVAKRVLANQGPRAWECW